MVVYTLKLGQGFQSNCYVLENDNKEAIAFDIGGDAGEFMEFLHQNDITLKKILLTHGHFDHIMGVSEVAEKTGAEVFIHKEDEDMLSSTILNLSSFMGDAGFKAVSEYTTVVDGQTIDFSGVPVKVLHTPGHTRGSVCYICENKIFSGDTLFKRSIGRTDFPGGSYSEIMNSLAKIKSLYKSGEDFEVFPGHESLTTLSAEISGNMYMKEA